MADYTRLTPMAIDQLLSFYQLGKIKDISTLEGGQANSSIKIQTSKGEFTLSVCDEKSPKEILTLTRLLVFLENNNFPSTRLVTTREGDPFILYENKPVYIKEYLPGRVCTSLTPSMLSQVGRAMAGLHKMVPDSKINLPRAFPYGLSRFDEVFSMGHPFVDWLKRKKDFLEPRIDMSMPKGLIHGDIFWDNLVFTGENLSAILDFEEACHYFKLYDLSMAFVGCCASTGTFQMDKVKHMIQGYQASQPLDRAEKKQLKLFMEYAALSAAFWRFRQYNIRYVSRGKKESYKELADLADQIHSMDMPEFMIIF